MDEQVQKRLEEEVTAWAKENKIVTNPDQIVRLITKLDDTVKIGSIKKRKLNIHGEELDVFNGACRAIEQFLSKADPSARANIALVLAETCAKIGSKYYDILIDKFNLSAKVNIYKAKDSAEKEAFRKLSKEEKEKIRQQKKQKVEQRKKEAEERRKKREEKKATTK